MTIKGPYAHDYRGGLGDLLGWVDSRYDYADTYDVEAHRRYLKQQQQQQQQQEYGLDSSESNRGGFANALHNPPPAPTVSFAADTQVQPQTNSATQEEERRAKWERTKKQALNVIFFIVCFLIWLASQGI